MSPPARQPNSLSSTNQRPGAHITIEFENIKLAHPTTLQHILEMAEHVLNKNRAVMQAPSLKDVEGFMVESETMVKPHYVTVTKNGTVTCNDCPSWNAYKICSHSLAVAEKSGRTVDYLKNERPSADESYIANYIR